MVLVFSADAVAGPCEHSLELRLSLQASTTYRSLGRGQTHHPLPCKSVLFEIRSDWCGVVN
jgi:hypothetical protein